MVVVNSKMNFMGMIKKYYLLITIILAVILLVLIRSFGSMHFEPGAKKWYIPSVTQANIITETEAKNLPGNKLIIYIDDSEIVTDKEYSGTLHITAEKILKSDNIEMIRNHKGPVLLSSASISIAARTWMLLSQLGLKNIFIISDDPGNEVLKYKFRPDTTTRPEL
jgi:hypothetical protein